MKAMSALDLPTSPPTLHTRFGSYDFDHERVPPANGSSDDFGQPRGLASSSRTARRLFSLPLADSENEENALGLGMASAGDGLQPIGGKGQEKRRAWGKVASEASPKKTARLGFTENRVVEGCCEEFVLDEREERKQPGPRGNDRRQDSVSISSVRLTYLDSPQPRFNPLAESSEDIRNVWISESKEYEATSNIGIRIKGCNQLGEHEYFYPTAPLSSRIPTPVYPPLGHIVYKSSRSEAATTSYPQKLKKDTAVAPTRRQCRLIRYPSPPSLNTWYTRRRGQFSPQAARLAVRRSAAFVPLPLNAVPRAGLRCRLLPRGRRKDNTRTRTSGSFQTHNTDVIHNPVAIEDSSRCWPGCFTLGGFFRFEPVDLRIGAHWTASLRGTTPLDQALTSLERGSNYQQVNRRHLTEQESCGSDSSQTGTQGRHSEMTKGITLHIQIQVPFLLLWLGLAILGMARFLGIPKGVQLFINIVWSVFVLLLSKALRLLEMVNASHIVSISLSSRLEPIQAT